MLVDEFDYELPANLIAQEPVEPRDASRLLVLRRGDGGIEHRTFRDLPRFLNPGDCLVLNDTRVSSVRLIGHRAGGGEAEFFLLSRVGADGECSSTWEALVRPGRRLPPGSRVTFGEGDARLSGEVVSRLPAGGAIVRLAGAPDPDTLIARLGRVPLPPYIRREPPDPERYQTVYARADGSAAAPTAGLHFTPGLLEAIEEAGVTLARVTLHVGPGTFRPVKTERIEDHHLHAEYYRVPAETVAAMERARRRGGRVVAVGTTVARALEQAALTCCEGWTEIFIYPGFRFRAVDVLVTNFHLPRSTLLMLVSAFAGAGGPDSNEPAGGRDLILSAYRAAIGHGYRFFSFGDAMLIL